MEVLIVDKQEDKVRVNTEIGWFNGIWCSLEPVVSKKYIVELDSDEVLTLNEIELSSFKNPCIEYANETTYITGKVEEIQDNMMILRLQKSIMMLEILSDINFTHYIGNYVRISLSEIKLYDTGIY